MNKQAILKQVEKSVMTCTKCRLYKTAKCGVPGEGNINSEIVFIGEAPGFEEDKTGRPFVGRAGKLLDSLLKGIGMKREDVWIGNIVKHRPPENRDPLPDEIAACKPYLTTQLNAIKPKIVITLGRFAMNHFYPNGKISRDHGTPIKLRDYVVFPVYHPAAALRSEIMFSDLKNDFKKIPVLVRSIKKESTAKEQKEVDGEGQIGLKF